MSVDVTLQHRLPHSLEAERALLGAVLLDNEALRSVTGILESGDFFLESHRRIFTRMRTLSEDNCAIDLLTLHEGLERAGGLEAAGGSAYLSSLVDGVPRVCNVEHYAQIVKEKAQLRCLIRLAHSIESSVLTGIGSAEELAKKAEKKLRDLTSSYSRRWTTQVVADIPALIGEAETFFNRYLILPPGTVLVLGLWAAATHIFKAFDSFPYLVITSPTKRCGKTRLSEVLEQLCAHPLRAASLSEAAVFRLIDKRAPTLIIDEAELLRDKKSERAQAIRGLLNAGHRKGSVVYRCVGPSQDVREFEVFGPKAIVAIGDVPDTVRDRSIVIPMQRKKPNERVGRLIFKQVRAVGGDLRERIATTVSRHREDIEQIFQACDLEFLEDREAENWSPIFSVCSVLAPGRLSELRDVALGVTRIKAVMDADESLRMRLVSDLKGILADRQPNGVHGEHQAAMPSETLVARLREEPESPWADYDLNQRKLARLLKPFDVHPRQVWVAGRNVRGYLADDLKQILSRYLAVEALETLGGPRTLANCPSTRR